MTMHQRKGSSSNSAVGSDFEKGTFRYFQRKIPGLIQPFWLPIGYIEQKNHKFDMGSSQAKVIIECKSHTWTEGGNVPSAKLTTWDQAMLYFFLAPRSYRKIFAVKRHMKTNGGETLAEYYLRTHSHVIPDEVEFWEKNEEKNRWSKIDFDLSKRFTGIIESEKG